MDNWLRTLVAGDEENDVLRRKFLFEMAALGATAAMLRPAAIIDLNRRMQLSAVAVDELEWMVRRATGTWNEMKPPTLLRLATGMYETLRVLARNAGSENERQLQHLTARAATIAGLASRFVGEPTMAASYLSAALGWAVEAGDSYVQALALTWSADISSAVQHGEEGPSIPFVRRQLDAAESLIDDAAPPALVAQVLLRQAEEHAVAGDLAAALDYVERVAFVWEQGEGPDRDLYGMRWRGIMREAFRANILLLGGRPAEAVPILNGVVSAYPESASNTLAAQTDLAAAYARLGELERSVDLLRRAWPKAVNAGFRDRQARIRGVRWRDLQGWAREPLVRRLDEVLAVAG